MRIRRRLLNTFLIAGIGAGATVGGLTWHFAELAAAQGADDLREQILMFGAGGGAALLALLAVLGSALDRALTVPLTGLARGLKTSLHANPDHEIDGDAAAELGELSGAVLDAISAMAQGRAKLSAQIDDATQGIAVEKDRLEAVLRDLHEGVIICNLNHQILLYNHRAVELLHVSGEIGLGRSLFRFTNRQPFLHALERLNNRLIDGRGESRGLTAPFVASTSAGDVTLQCKMTLLTAEANEPSSYVITFDDRTHELAELGRRDHLLRQATDGMRRPLANLRAAAEILVEDPPDEPVLQQKFQQVVRDESHILSVAMEEISAEFREIITGHWPMTDIYSANLLNAAVRRLREDKGIEAIMTGVPHWLYGDSYTLLELLHFLAHAVQKVTGASMFDFEASGADGMVAVEIIWSGPAVSETNVQGWLSQQLDEALGGITVRGVLDRHRTDLWSLSGEDGRARIRLPLTAGQTEGELARGNLPARPEFYDFSLLNPDSHHEGLGSRPLKSLTYVVFDTETTGLKPSEGDEMISIAGVRVVNGRIMTGESFSRLIHPGREIPKSSIRFHGITDDMVEDQPSHDVILSEFHRYVDDAVLVAHNAAFDMKFLKLKEQATGVVFDNPVLDTLLLSVYLHDHIESHTLDAIAERFGVGVDAETRHTALGDSLVTAALFMKMIDLLEANGITTLDQARDAASKMVEVRKQQEQF